MSAQQQQQLLQQQLQQLLSSPDQQGQIGQINQMLSQASDAIMCDTNCQKQRTADELRQKYETAKINYVTGPEQTEKTFRDYYVFQNGESQYNELIDKKYGAEADKMAEKYKDIISQQIHEINVNLKSYDAVYINYRNIVDFYKKLEKENRQLEKDIKNAKSETVTNQRKTVYEDQGLDTLDQTYTILWYLYIILAFIVIGKLLLSNSNGGSVIKKIIYGILILFYPFYSNWLISLIIQIYQYIVWLLPKNIHQSIRAS